MPDFDREIVELTESVTTSSPPDVGPLEEARQALRRANSLNPDQEARIANESMRTGIPAETLRMQMGTQQARAIPPIHELPPNVAQFLRNPTMAAISRDDVTALAYIDEAMAIADPKSAVMKDGRRVTDPSLGPLQDTARRLGSSTLFDLFDRRTWSNEMSDAWESNSLGLEANELAYQAMAEGNMAAAARLDWIEERLGQIKPARSTSAWWIGNAAQVLQQMPYMAEKAAERGWQLGAAGAAVGMLGGPGGSATGGMTGLGLGVKWGAVEALHRQMAGEGLRVLRGITDSDGQPIDPTIAGIAAGAYGMVGTALEFTGLCALADAAGGRIVKSQIMRTLFKQALGSDTVRRDLASLASRYGQAALTEGATESSQQAAQIIMQYAAENMDAIAKGIETPQQSLASRLVEGWGDIREAGLAGASVGISAATLGVPIHAAQAVEHRRNALAMREYAQTVRDRITDAKTTGRVPGALKTLAQAANMNLRATLDAGELLAAVENDPVSMKDLGLEPEDVRSLSILGRDVEIDIMDTGAIDGAVFERILPLLRPDSFSESTQELRDAAPEEVERVARAFREADQQRRATNSQFNRVRKEILDATGDRVVTETVMETVRLYAQRMSSGGLDPAALLKKINVRRQGQAVDWGDLSGIADISDDDIVPFDFEGLAITDQDMSVDIDETYVPPDVLSEESAIDIDRQELNSANASLREARSNDAIAAVERAGGISKTKAGESDALMNMPKALRRRAIKRQGMEPDRMAAVLQDQGIGDGTVNGMFAAMAEAYQARMDLAGRISAARSSVTAYDAVSRRLGQAERGSIKFYGDDASRPVGYIIQLFQGSDPSTLIHELGHFFLQEFRAVALDDDTATPSIRDDWKRTKEWLGIAEDDATITNEQHEQWARGFEAFLMEGRAPTVELVGIFERFKKWMKSVYRSVAALNVELNDDIRTVFGNMFRADDEAAAMWADVTSKLETPEFLEKLRITGAERDKIRALMERGLSEAQGDLFRRRNSQRKQLLAEFRKQATREVDATPVYQLIDKIRKAGGIPAEYAQQTFGASTLAGLRRHRLISKENSSSIIDVEIMAGESSFADWDTALIEIVSSQSRSKAINAGIDRRMQEHGAAFEASLGVAASEEIGDLLTAMRNAIQRQLPTSIPDDPASAKRQRNEQSFSLDAIKQAAREEIGRTRVRDALRPRRYLGELAKQHRKAMRAVMQEDWRTASEAIDRARLLYELAAEAQRMRELRDRGIRRLIRSAKAKRGNIEQIHQQHLWRLLRRFRMWDRAPQTTRQDLGTLRSIVDGTKTFDGWSDANGFTDVSANYSDWILDDQASVRYMDMQVSEMQEALELGDTLARRGRTIVDDRMQAYGDTIESYVDKVVNQIQGMPGRLLDPDVNTAHGKAVDFMRKVGAEITHARYWFQWIDGFRKSTEKIGLMEDLFYAAPLEREGIRSRLMEEQLAEIDPALRRLTDSMVRRLGRGPIDMAGIEVPEWMRRKGQKTWRAENLLAAALNMGNDYNRNALQSGYGITDGQMEALSGMLTEAEWSDVQAIWNSIDKLWPESARIHERIYQDIPPKVAAVPLTVQTADGKTITVAGGYYPVAYDARRHERKRQQDEMDMLRESKAAAFPPKRAKRDQLKARVGSGGKPVDLSIGVLSRHLDFSTRFIAFAELARDMDRVKSSERFQQAFEGLIGPQEYRMLDRYIASMLAVERPPYGILQHVADWMRMLTAPVLMGLNVASSLRQLAAIPELMADVGVGSYVRGAGSLLTDILAGRSPIDDINARSQFMKNRLLDRERDLMRTMRLPSFDRLETAREWRSRLQTWVLMPVMAPNYAAELVAYRVAYQRGLELYDNDPQQANTYAEATILRTAPSGMGFDMSQIERNRDGFSRVMTSLGSWAIKHQTNIARDLRAMRQGRLDAAIRFAQVSMVAPVIMDLIMSMLWGRDFGDEDDTTAQDLLADLSRSFVSGIPFASGIAYGISTQLKGYTARTSLSGAPISLANQIYSRTMAGIGQAARSPDDPEAVSRGLWAVAGGLGYTVGLPVEGVHRRLVQGWEQYQGEDGISAYFSLIAPDPAER